MPETSFEQRRAREKYCKQWLKIQLKTVSSLVYAAAMAGIANGLLFVVQAALLAFVLHQLLIEKQILWAHLNDLQFDLSTIIGGLFHSQSIFYPLANTLISALAVLFIVMVLRSVATYFFQTLGFEAASTIKNQLREQFSQHFPQLNPSYLKQQQTGELATTTLEQIEALELYFSRYCPQQIIIAILPLLMIVLVMPINWVVGLIFLSSLPLVIFFMAVIGISAAVASRGQFLAMARMGGYFLDRLQGLPTLKLFGQAQRELAEITLVADNFRATTMKVLRIAFLSSTVLEFFSAVGIALIALYVGLGLLGKIDFGPAQHITLQQALFVLLLAPEFFMPLRQLSVFYHDRAAALGATDLILQVLEAPVLTWEKSEEFKTNAFFCLQLEHVSKNYGERQVLQAIDLAIKTGEKVALVGESGAGKTTLLKLLLGFEIADTGMIRIRGKRLTPELAHEYIAWVGQHASIFYGSISDNMSLFNHDYSTDEINIAAKAAGVTEFSDALPDGLETMIGERGYGLSGGQIQRIALARAFLKNAPIVLLDEPTAHLDETQKEQLLARIELLFKDKTVLIASHDPVVIAKMSRQIVLAEGVLQ